MSVETEPPLERSLSEQGQAWQQLMHRDKARGEKEKKKGCDYRQQYCAEVPMSGSYGEPRPERSLNQARPDMTMHRDTARGVTRQYCTKPPTPPPSV